MLLSQVVGEGGGGQGEWRWSRAVVRSFDVLVGVQGALEWQSFHFNQHVEFPSLEFRVEETAGLHPFGDLPKAVGVELSLEGSHLRL